MEPTTWQDVAFYFIDMLQIVILAYLAASQHASAQERERRRRNEQHLG